MNGITDEKVDIALDPKIKGQGANGFNSNNGGYDIFGRHISDEGNLLSILNPRGIRLPGRQRYCSFDIQTALWLAEYAQLAYFYPENYQTIYEGKIRLKEGKDKIIPEKDPEKYERYVFLHDSYENRNFMPFAFKKGLITLQPEYDTQGYVFHAYRSKGKVKEDAIVVAFRGSELLFNKDGVPDVGAKKDWGGTNFCFWDTKLDWDVISRPNIRVHMGFAEAYSQKIQELVMEKVCEFYKDIFKNGPGHIYFTGHSLGGALAVLSALHMSLYLQKVNKAPKITMYNFGSPCVGFMPFVNLYNSMVNDSHRLVIKGDPVPGLLIALNFLSLGKFPYCHVDKERLLIKPRPNKQLDHLWYLRFPHSGGKGNDLYYYKQSLYYYG
jgi:hypothetical protein